MVLSIIQTIAEAHKFQHPICAADEPSTLRIIYKSVCGTNTPLLLSSEAGNVLGLTRTFKTSPLPQKEVQRCVDSAHIYNSCHPEYPWHFVFVLSTAFSIVSTAHPTLYCQSKPTLYGPIFKKIPQIYAVRPLVVQSYFLN